MDYQNQIELERLFNKNQLHKRLSKEFSDPFIFDRCDTQGIPHEIGAEIVVQMYLHKRATVPVLVGIMARHFESLQDCADMLLRAVDADLMDWNDLTKQFVYRINISQEVQDELDRYQYPLPMIYTPRECVTNTDVGYYTHKASVILKDNYHEEDVCLDHINRMNSIKLTINADTSHMVKNQWKNLDKPKDGEEFADYKRRVDAFEKYTQTAYDVMEHIFMAGNEFHLTHRYDKRGRTYSQGYHVNVQGNAWNKAVIEFADKELVDG